MVDVAARRAEYESRGTHVEELDPDPIVQFRRWLAEAVEASLVEPTGMATSIAGTDAVPIEPRRAVGASMTAASCFSRTTEREGQRRSPANPRAALCSAGSHCSGRCTSARLGRAASTTRRRTRTSRPSAWKPDRRVGVTAERGGGDRAELERLVADAREGDSAACRCRDLRSGVATVCDPRRSNSGRAAAAGCTTACATGAPVAWRIERLAP